MLVSKVRVNHVERSGVIKFHVDWIDDFSESFFKIFFTEARVI